MSLRAFHVFFVSVAALMAVSVGWLAARELAGGHGAEARGLLVLSAATVVAVVPYVRWFLRKVKTPGLAS